MFAEPEHCSDPVWRHHIKPSHQVTGYLAIVAIPCSVASDSVEVNHQFPLQPAVSVHIHPYTATMGNIHTCGPNECVVISGKKYCKVSFSHLAPCSTCFVHFTSHMAFLVTFDNNMICSDSDSYFYHLSDKYLFKLIKNKWNRSHWIRTVIAYFQRFPVLCCNLDTVV